VRAPAVATARARDEKIVQSHERAHEFARTGDGDQRALHCGDALHCDATRTVARAHHSSHQSSIDGRATSIAPRQRNGMVDGIFTHAFGAFGGVANGVARHESRVSWVN
jgi:hypothetical protein